jgi:hypothetical protein
MAEVIVMDISYTFVLDQMNSLKWLGVWGAVGPYGEPTEEDKSNWSLEITRVLDDPNGCFYLKQCLTYIERTDLIPLVDGECTQFQHFTPSPIRFLNFK